MRQQEVQKVHPGLTCFREGVRGIPVESIPGIRETGWRPVARATRVARITEECNDPDTLLATLKNVLTTVSFEPSKLLMRFFKNVNCNYVQCISLILFWYLKYSNVFFQN